MVLLVLNRGLRRTRVSLLASCVPAVTTESSAHASVLVPEEDEAHGTGPSCPAQPAWPGQPSADPDS